MPQQVCSRVRGLTARKSDSDVVREKVAVAPKHTFRFVPIVLTCGCGNEKWTRAIETRLSKSYVHGFAHCISTKSHWGRRKTFTV